MGKNDHSDQPEEGIAPDVGLHIDTPQRTAEAGPDEAMGGVGNRFRAQELERHIGERLRFLRRLSRFSLQHVGREIGVSFQQIQKYESGTNRVSAVLLAEFSNFFHLPMDWFIGPFNTCLDRDVPIVMAPYGRVMQQLFRGLRHLDDADCDLALDVVCRVAKVAPGIPETRLPRLRRVLQDGTRDANEFIVEVVTRLADAHVSTDSSVGVKPDIIATPQPEGRLIRTILMVDDDPDVLRISSASLASAGFAVRTARSGDEALSMLASDVPVDALVTDYAMVGMDGLELLAQADQYRPGLPGIVITGFAEALRLSDLPCRVEVLRKPFRRMELVGRLRMLIDGQGSAEATRRHTPVLRLITEQ